MACRVKETMWVLLSLLIVFSFLGVPFIYPTTLFIVSPLLYISLSEPFPPLSSVVTTEVTFLFAQGNTNTTKNIIMLFF
jgi:hypothetical protein